MIEFMTDKMVMLEKAVKQRLSKNIESIQKVRLRMKDTENLKK